MANQSISNDFLRKHSMFGGFTDSELNIIQPLLETLEFEQNSKVLIQGEPNSRVYLIVSGMVKVTKHHLHHQNEEREITRLQAGDSFGEMELIDIQNCAATITCLSDVKTVSMSNYSLYKLSKIDIHIYAMLIMNLARDISRRLRATDSMLALVSK